MGRGHPDWQPWTALQRFAATGGATPYEQMITIPANTASASPTTQDMVLEKGFISRVWIRFPSGPAGLTHVAIWDDVTGTQLFPGGVGTWFTGDNEIIEFDTEVDVPYDETADEYRIQLRGYNEDDSYEHSVLVRVWVVALP